MRTHTRSLLRAIRDTIAPRGDEAVTGCELGVWRGDNAIDLLRALPKLRLIMVDRWRQYSRDHADARMAAHDQDAHCDALALVHRQTLEYEERRIIVAAESGVAAGLLPDGFLDFVFIDADHRYDAVRRDLQLWYPKLRPGGLLAGHDYRGQRQGAFGVKPAVDEFAGAAGLTVRQLPGRVWWAVKPP